MVTVASFLSFKETLAIRTALKGICQCSGGWLSHQYDLERFWGQTTRRGARCLPLSHAPRQYPGEERPTLLHLRFHDL